MACSITTLAILFCTLCTFSQNVSIGLFTNDTSWNTVCCQKVRNIYETQFGIGNVKVTNYETDYSTPFDTLIKHDIIIVNLFIENNVSQSLADNLVMLYNGGKHLVISSEGSLINNDKKFCSYVWNGISGQSITETDANDYGTETPPRFHPSSGPGGLASHNMLGGSSRTYASFGNMNPLNILHQRTQEHPVCSNIEGLDALFPHQPKLNEGTMYINGEIYFPYANPIENPQTKSLTKNLVILHKTLLSGNQTKLNLLNSWINNPSKKQSFKLNKENINLVLPNIITPNSDGTNDAFKIVKTSHNVVSLNFTVINRWGSEVYSTNDLNIDWSGTDSHGHSLDDGAYYYYLEVTFDNDCNIDYSQMALNFKGNVEIVR